MKARKTYGINGLLEWHGYVECSGVRMKVDFTNGSVTAFGVAPATFTTNDPLTQHIIEHSEQFKKGRIRCVMSVALPDDEPKKAAKAVENKPEVKQEVKAEEPAAEVKEDEKPEVKKVEVACADDAKAYLVENFGIAARNLRSLKAINDSAAANGIEFVGI
jgi:hypothetical protein